MVSKGCHIPTIQSTPAVCVCVDTSSPVSIGQKSITMWSEACPIVRSHHRAGVGPQWQNPTNPPSPRPNLSDSGSVFDGGWWGGGKRGGDVAPMGGELMEVGSNRDAGDRRSHCLLESPCVVFASLYVLCSLCPASLKGSSTYNRCVCVCVCLVGGRAHVYAQGRAPTTFGSDRKAT